MMAKSIKCAVCVMVSVVSLMLFGGVSFDGSILSFDVASGATETYSDTIPSTCTKVVKTGSGTIEVTGNSVDFHGNVEIKEGVVVATHMNALGRGTGAEGTTSPNTISVSKGAQLRATFAPDKSDGNPEGRGFRSIVEIAGDGPDGTGAFYYERGSNPFAAYWLIWELRLADDASIGGNILYSARNYNLNQKTLTVKTSPNLYLYWGKIYNPGNIIVENNFSISGTTVQGGADNFLTLSESSKSFYFRGVDPFGWSVLWNNPGKCTVENPAGGGDGTKNVVNGSFVCNGSELVVWPQTSSCGVTFGGGLSVPNGFLTIGGGGKVYFRGLTNAVKYVSMQGSSMDVDGTDLFIASHIQANGGVDIRFNNAGDVVMTNSSTQLRSRRTLGELPTRMTLSGRTHFKNMRDDIYLHAGMSLNFGSGTEKTWGTVSLSDGVTMSNNFSVGFNGWGAVYQSGGDVYWNSLTRQSSGNLGCGPDVGYGYWGMDGGTLTIPHFITVGGGAADSTGFFVQRGGIAKLTGEDLKLSTRGHAIFYVGNGASFSQTAGSTYMGYTDGTQGSGGDAVITVEGAGSVFSAYWFVGVQNRPNFTSYVNINDGGVFETFYIVNQSGSDWKWPEGTRQYVSFNGGVWRNPAGRESNHNMFHSGDRYAPDRLLCHKKGAIFDTGRSGLNLNVPLTAPEGKVFKSITLPDAEDFLAVTNIGPMRISITGSGVGATAFAPFDNANGRIRGDVLITSPGTGYSESDTVVKVWNDDGTKSWNCTFELEDATSGGITKLGAGVLNLCCANTYGGKTSIKAGRLEMQVEGAIPDGLPLEIAAGSTLTLSNNLSVTTLEGAGRTIGGVDKSLTVTESFVLGSENLSLGGSLSVEGNLIFADGATIDVSDAELLGSAPKKHTFIKAGYIWGNPAVTGIFGDRWRVSRNAAGTSLTLRYIRGTTFVLR